jgi:hypothetical protein
VYKKPSETAAASRSEKEHERGASGDADDRAARRRTNNKNDNHERTPATNREEQGPIDNLVCGIEKGLCIQS